MAISHEDAAYMQRIGEIKRQSHKDASREHLALSLEERLRRSWELSVASGATKATRDDDPTPFYDLARSLGLYTP